MPHANDHHDHLHEHHQHHRHHHQNSHWVSSHWVSRSRDSNAMASGAAPSSLGVCQPETTSKAAPPCAVSSSPGASQPRTTSRDAPSVLRVVHLCELQNCSCERPAWPLVWVPGEEKPRCFECAKPVQELSRLEPLDRAAARTRNRQRTQGLAPDFLYAGSADMRADTAAHPPQSSAAQPAQPAQPELLRRLSTGEWYVHCKWCETETRLEARNEEEA